MNRGKNIRQKIASHNEQKQSVIDLLHRLSPCMSEAPSGGAGQGDKIGNSIAKIDELNNILTAEVKELGQVLIEINAVIKKVKLKNKETQIAQVILERHFCLDKPECQLEHIACKINYSYRQTYRHYILGMLEVQKILKKQKMS